MKQYLKIFCYVNKLMPPTSDLTKCRDPQPNIRWTIGNHVECREEELQKTKGLNNERACMAPGPLHKCCCCLTWGVCRTPNTEREGISGSFAYSWDLFFLLVAQSSLECLCVPGLLHLTMSVSVDTTEIPFLF